jgi:hypothetical protein
LSVGAKMMFTVTFYRKAYLSTRLIAAKLEPHLPVDSVLRASTERGWNAR